MATLPCPICGRSLKLENVKRHFANVHPGRDPSSVISEQEHEEIRRSSQPGVRRAGLPRSVWIVLIVVVVVAGSVVGLPYLLHAGPASNFNVLTYCGGEGTVEHYHPLLVIHALGSQVPLPEESGQPADIGYVHSPEYTNPSNYCPTGEVHALHTHDASGIIHVELPVAPSSPPTLGEFFTIWGQALSSAAVWTYSGHVTATMYNADTGMSTDFSASPGSIPLYVPRAGPNGDAYPIPQSLIFSGAYGNGASGGVFSGEVIWLNVTA